MCIRADLTFDSISKSPAGKVQLESTHEIDMAMMIREGVEPSLYQIQTSSGEKMPTREGKWKPKLKRVCVHSLLKLFEENYQSMLYLFLMTIMWLSFVGFTH